MTGAGVCYVGVGRLGGHYVATVVSGEGDVTENFSAACDPAGLAPFLARIRDLTKRNADSVCSIDTTNGILGDLLLRAGIRVHRVLPELPPGSGLNSMAPARLAAGARLAFKGPPAVPPQILAAVGGMAQGRGREMLRQIVDGKEVEQRLERSGSLVKRVPATRRRAALTFDDGPTPDVTERVLDVLAQNGVRATFFCVGTQVRSCAWLCRRIQSEGHLLANHSWSHAYLPDLPVGLAMEQITATNHAIKDAVGESPRYFRPPYGARSATLLERVAAVGMTTVLWDVDPTDWASPKPGVVVNRVVDRVQPGSIILLHDGPASGADVASVLRELVNRLCQERFELVRLDEFDVELTQR